MADEPMNNQASLALGTLIGTVNGLVETLKAQNVSSAEYRKEQKESEAKSRQEFMDIFSKIWGEIKTSNEIVQKHIQEDLVYHGAMNEVVNWKKDAEVKIDTLWDGQNKQKGALLASTSIGGVLGGAIVLAVEWLKK